MLTWRCLSKAPVLPCSCASMRYVPAAPQFGSEDVFIPATRSIGSRAQFARVSSIESPGARRPGNVVVDIQLGA